MEDMPVLGQTVLRQNTMGDPAKFDNLLNTFDCQRILQMTEQIPFESGTVGLQNGREEDNIRKSKIKWIPNDENFRWIYDKVIPAVMQVNQEWYMYELYSLEPLQLTRYDAEDAEFYASHTDTKAVQGGHVRKLSFTIQLSDPKDYEGGDVIIYDDLQSTITLDKTQGAMGLFPSYKIHEVKPVTKGTRYSLVGWFSGMPFR